MADISNFDLNLLRLFDAVYRHRNISRAAAELGLSQPATSQALTRLRLKLKDPLFERAGAGVRPTHRADRLARSVQQGLAMLQTGLVEEDRFDARTSTARLTLHLTDIGEARFLPRLMETLRDQAPHLQILTAPWPLEDIPAALHSGDLDFAIGFLPRIEGTAHCELLRDRYELLLRGDHPFARAARRRQFNPARLPSTTDVSTFLESLATAWKSGEVRPTHRKQPGAERWWRTRADPFAHAWPVVEGWLNDEPTATAKELMDRLAHIVPDAYASKAQLRTLQRRIKAWRAEKAKDLILGQLRRATPLRVQT